MNTTATIVITGSREFVNQPLMEATLDAAAAMLHPHSPITLVHGNASGADKLASLLATRNQWRVEVMPAQWDQHSADCPNWHRGQATCKMAGHRRNAAMLARRPDLVLGFPTHAKDARSSDGTPSSRCTWGTIAKAIEAGLPTIVAWNGFLWPGNDSAKAMIASHAAHLGERPGTAGQAAAALLRLPF